MSLPSAKSVDERRKVILGGLGLMLGDVAAGTHVGSRDRNEDRFVARLLPRRQSALLAIADGLGGEASGELASGEAISAFESFVDNHQSMSPGELLHDACDAANLALRNTSRQMGARLRSTLVGALVNEQAAWIAAVGDSRAYIVTPSEWRQITTDHTWAEEEVRSGLLERDAAIASPSRNVLTRSLGSSDKVAIDIFGPIPTVAGDGLVLCSDGLYSVVEPDEIARIVREHQSSPATNNLIALAQARRGQDNATVVVFKAN